MLKDRLKNSIQTGLEKFVWLLCRPFAEAETLERYSAWGYGLAGVGLIILALVFWWLGLFSTPISQVHPIIRGLYKWMAQRGGVLEYFPDNYVTLLFFPIMVYAFMFLPFCRSIRRWIGEHTANFCFWLLNKAVAAGEWFLEHRWNSLLFIILLTSALAYLIDHEVHSYNARQKLTADFSRWLGETEYFIEHYPFSKVEKEKYARIKPLWNADFDGLLKLPDGSPHPATCLHAMLEELNKEPSPLHSVLESRVSTLKQYADQCAPRPINKMDVPEARAYALINLLLGRAHVRLAESAMKQGFYNDFLQDLVNASDYFDKVTLRPDDDDVKVKQYTSDAINGKGTIYGNALGAYKRGETAPLTKEQIDNLRQICENAEQCLTKAYQAFDRAGKDFADCSYQANRRINNIVDLLLLIGLHYDDDMIRKIETDQTFLDIIKTPANLAEGIERKLQQIMSCNRSELLPTHILTVAQGYAICAALRKKANKGALDDGKVASNLSTSGRYLRLYNSLEPEDAPKNAVAPTNFFCSNISGSGVDFEFDRAMTTPDDALPPAEQLLKKIKGKCP